jgi:acyl-lipid omega-6 desaturase (Delta-12 desaturase)
MIDKKKIYNSLAKYRNPDLKRSVWQLSSSIMFYTIAWSMMYLSLSVSLLLTLALAVPTAGLLIRIFIIFHDCGHGSFFKSAKANHFWGTLTGFLVYTPFYRWQYEHAVHHRTSGNLDRSGVGDIWMLTVDQYIEASTWTKIKYRIYRNPFVLFTIGALITFLFTYRFIGEKKDDKKNRLSVHFTNLVITVVAALLIWLIGLKEFLLIQLSILAVSSSLGVWLFYLQHQFEEVYWERQENWDVIRAALEGSSYYKLPKVLQWFTGNIGFHHIHHLSPAIPNYYLEKCHKDNPIFQEVKPVTLLASFKSFSLRLYDEAKGKLVGYPAKIKAYKEEIKKQALKRNQFRKEG